MTPPDNLIDLFQDFVVGRIASDPLFADVLIVEVRKGEAVTEVLQRLSGERETDGKKAGAIVYILLPRLKPKTEESGPQYEVRNAVQVAEYPKLNNAPNGLQKSSRLLSQKIDQLFHQWVIAGRAVMVESVEPLSEEDGLVGFMHTLLWEAGQPRPVQCLAPGVDQEADVLGLNTPEDGVTIYYTFDGSFPGPSNADAQRYDGPIGGVNGGQILMAAAYADDGSRNGSDVIRYKTT